MPGDGAMEFSVSVKKADGVGVAGVVLTLTEMSEQAAQALVMRLAAQVMREEKRAAIRPEYEVKFLAPGEKLIECIKEIRAHLGISLKDAKDAAEAGPHVILKTPDIMKAQSFCMAMKACGASVEFELAA